MNTAITLLVDRPVHGHGLNHLAGGPADAIGEQLVATIWLSGLLGLNTLCTPVHATHAFRVHRGGRMQRPER
jgi:hypothetical protein